jgi:hypothetical protein
MPTPIEQMPSDDRIFALFVGDSGAGKTSTAPWFPGEKLILDIDKRYRGLLGHTAKNKDYNLKGIHIEHFKGENILTELENLFTKYESFLNGRQTFPYSTMYFDGFTSFDQLVSKDAIEFTGGAAGKVSEGGKGGAGNKHFGDLDLMGWDAFAYQQQAFKNVITALKYIFPCNVICTAHWTDRYEEGKVVGRDINLRKKIINQVILWFDEVYFFEKKTTNKLTSKGEAAVDTKHIVHFRNDIARTTFANLPDSMDWTNRNFHEILMKGKRGELIDGSK